MVDRPNVDVVIPFGGPSGVLNDLIQRLRLLDILDADTITIAVNRAELPEGAEYLAADSGVRLVHASRVASSYYARNCGVRVGSAPWILFLDDDVDAPAGLISKYFATSVAGDVGLLAGGITSTLREGKTPTLAERYAADRELLDDRHSAELERPFAQTANCMVRREALAAIGGFAEVYSGGDADMSWRLAAAGWRIEFVDATVSHWGRSTLVGLLRKAYRYGMAEAWLAQSHQAADQLDGGGASFPVRAKRSARRLLSALAAADRNEFVNSLLDAACTLARVAGKRNPERNVRLASPQ